MAGSNGTWGELSATDDGLASVWDTFAALPAAGTSLELDSFVARKGISHAALVRCGARLASSTTLAFGGPGWLKYRDMVTGKRWSHEGCDWSQLKIVRHGAKRTDTVIVAEGETDSAKLSMVYDCDVAMLPSGAEHFPPTFAEQLRGYRLVLVGLDADDAGERGSAAILAALPQAVRFAPPENSEHDWGAAAEYPPLPEPKGEQVGGIHFDDIAGLLRNGVDEPEILVDGLFYTEGVHWLSGHPGSGKTTLAMYAAIQVMLEGRHVVWLDYEGGVRPTIRRLLASQCPIELALDYFHYAGWPGDAPQFFADLAARWQQPLIVVDSASKALETAGLDENSPSEVTKWAVPIVKATKQHHVPVVVIDHVTKSATRDTKYSRGAGSKLADSDVSWFVHPLTPFNRTQVGTLSVHQQKDREGFLPFTSWFQVGDGAGWLPVSPCDQPADEVEGDQPAI